MTIEDILVRHSVDRVELTAWIEERWVQPQQTEAGVFFDEADEARVALICELRRDLSVNEEALPLVLTLLDQLYSVRDALRRLTEALHSLPPSLRDEIKSHLGPDLDGSRKDG
ncbi:MAG: hypothetical protein EXQ86_12045 [Rhodospirillales bacterium]|nr:hypothetical protein [Rhodospirillales bacterium]